MSASQSDQPPASAGSTAPSAVSGTGGDQHVVDVRVAAEAAQIPVMRAVVGDLAMRADFDVDSIADLRLAVDEACSSLVRIAAPQGSLQCRFRASSEGLSITVEVDSADPSGPRTNTFSWRVLSALTDTVSSSVEASENGADSHVVRIELSKGRMVHE